MSHCRTILESLLILLVCHCSSVTAEVRQPAVAGQFYPADRQALSAMVNEHLNKAIISEGIDGDIIALIVPHAGLVYSGQIAAHAYKLIEGKTFERVVLCGVSHRHRFQGLSVYGPGVTWKTPLGELSCDDTICQLMTGSFKGIEIIPQAHLQEHSLEVQLPYLQTVLSDFKIIPILMGYPDDVNTSLLEKALNGIPDTRRTILVASTDWQHYRSASEGWKLDSVGIECLMKIDADCLEKNLRDGKTEMCGGGAAVAVMRAAVNRGANRVMILKYGDSGDISDDKSSVVGYLAAVIYRSAEKSSMGESKVEGRPPSVSSGAASDSSLFSEWDLTPEVKRKLLSLARRSIQSYLENRALPAVDSDKILDKRGAAFVTLTRNGHLRGCIGQTAASESISKTVAYCAVQAAFGDPRFVPVGPDELPQLHIEISILTPLEKIISLDEIEVGRDGLMITYGNSRGLLLPQVAVSYRWSREEFLVQLCRKAGIPSDSYRSPEAVIYKFGAIVFGE
ncbi:MAG: AmmeMemoRadiSam system protein B [Candidatus Zixiibacteriota bacterium]